VKRLNTHLSSSSILKHNSKTYISKDDEEILLRSSLLIGHMSKYKPRFLYSADVRCFTISSGQKIINSTSYFNSENLNFFGENPPRDVERYKHQQHSTHLYVWHLHNSNRLQDEKPDEFLMEMVVENSSTSVSAS
jgi:hypothetical protein